MQTLDIAAVERALYTDGFSGQQGLFSREWGAELDEDLLALFQEGIRLPHGMLGRGPRRYYREIHPQRLRGFGEIVTNPWLTGVCERVLGPDYQIIEVGFDVPLPGAFDQPWHRDFPAPPRNGPGAPPHLPGLQHDHGRRHCRHGAVRDCPGHAVGVWRRF